MADNNDAPISPHAALIYTMVMVSAADRDMTDAELRTIGEVIRVLPVFEDFDMDRLSAAAGECAEILSVDDGLDLILDMIRLGLPEKLRETAYALACEVAAADRTVGQEELRLLEMVRDRLEVDPLAAAAIERAARARHARL